jgi:hypothetical protein
MLIAGGKSKMKQQRRQLVTRLSLRTSVRRAGLDCLSFLAASLFLVAVPLPNFSVLAQTKIVQAIPTKSFGYLPHFVAQ